MKMLACMLELFLHLIIPLLEFAPILQYLSTSWGAIPRESIECSCRMCMWPAIVEVRREFRLGDSKLLLSGLAQSLRVVTHSSWCSFLGIIPSHCSSTELGGQPGLPVPFILVPVPLSIHGGQGQGCVLLLWVCHRNPQGISGDVEYLKETAWLRPLLELCGQECNMHWRKLFYFLFCKQPTAWPGAGTGREWSAAGKELTWPLPLLLWFHGASQEDAQASVFAGHSDLFNPTQMASITILSTNIDYYDFP